VGAGRSRLERRASARSVARLSERTKARRGHGKAIVATARKLAILFWCMLTRGEDYAHQQPSSTKQKLRRLEITAGAPKRTKTAAGSGAPTR
jgi:transposase